jgi:hypothetical protein
MKRKRQKADIYDGHDRVHTSYAHPYGVKPEGNLYFSEGAMNIRKSLGSQLSSLSDVQLLDVFSYLTGEDLGFLASVNQCIYVLSHHEQLWKEVVLLHFGGAFTFHGQTWRGTY